MNKNRRYAVIIILVSNAILISLLESFIPIPIPVPGIKLGLANIITLIALVFLPLRDVLLVVTIRSLVVALLTRGVMMLPFSLGGGILSALLMAFLYKKLSRYFSIKGISIVGAIVHNTTQITIASFLLAESVILLYLPILLISAVITGFITGTIAEIAINEIKEKELLSTSNETVTVIERRALNK
ncbi:Gx transporter family protein [Bacillus sp. B15-48]|uniref:Gx transporter family protein n=1 Tax=Bacillus sp. B15-48 TaxID=1548601 RepID=UPI00193F6975|nr:Gx transporter family protein [Bacillus sp. B15-48]MBM4763034.1 heptaprenyl diphosphate synthase [Bacillus sp. B15-48]